MTAHPRPCDGINGFSSTLCNKVISSITIKVYYTFRGIQCAVINIGVDFRMMDLSEMVDQLERSFMCFAAQLAASHITDRPPRHRQSLRNDFGSKAITSIMINTIWSKSLHFFTPIAVNLINGVHSSRRFTELSFGNEIESFLQLDRSFKAAATSDWITGSFAEISRLRFTF